MRKIIFYVIVFLIASSQTIYSNENYLDMGLSNTTMEKVTEVPVNNDINKKGFNVSFTHYFLPIEKLNTDIGIGVGYTKSGDRDTYSTKDYRYEGFCFDNLPIFVSFKTKVYEYNNVVVSLKNNVGYSFNIGEDDYTVDKKYESKVPVFGDIYYTKEEWRRYSSENLDVKNGLHYSISLMAEYENIQGGVFYTINKAEGKLADKSINLDRDIYGVFLGVNF